MPQTPASFYRNESKKVKSRKLWTDKEIDILKTEFANKTKLKLIALKLGRTTTAINKFLSRSGIRPQKARTYIIHTTPKFTTHRIVIEPSLIATFRNFVDFSKIISYLISKNYKISQLKITSLKMFCPKAEYLLDGKPVSKLQLVILANKLRAEENKNLFRVFL